MTDNGCHVTMGHDWKWRRRWCDERLVVLGATCSLVLPAGWQWGWWCSCGALFVSSGNGPCRHP